MMHYLIISLIGMLLGCWAVWRLVSINHTKEADYLHGLVKKPDRMANCVRLLHPTAPWPRGLVLPSNLVGTSYRTQHPNFWTEEEP